jgi:hypothetical protein
MNLPKAPLKKIGVDKENAETSMKIETKAPKQDETLFTPRFRLLV